MYAQDYDEAVMPAYDYTGTTPGCSYITWVGCVNTADSTLVPNSSYLQPYTKSEGLKSCPTRFVTTEYYAGNSGYGYNWGAFPGISTAPFTVVSLADIDVSAETVVFADGAAGNSGPNGLDGIQATAFLNAPSIAWPSFHGRHTEFGNVLWADGHVHAERPQYVNASYSGVDVSFFRKNHLGDLIKTGNADHNYYYNLHK